MREDTGKAVQRSAAAAASSCPPASRVCSCTGRSARPQVRHLEAKVVIVKVAHVDDLAVQPVRVLRPPSAAVSRAALSARCCACPHSAGQSAPRADPRDDVRDVLGHQRRRLSILGADVRGHQLHAAHALRLSARPGQAGGRSARGAGPHVSLNDFSVFLCRLDTATRAASCARAAARRSAPAPASECKRALCARVGLPSSAPPHSPGGWPSLRRRSPRRARPARWWSRPCTRRW